MRCTAAGRRPRGRGSVLLLFVGADHRADDAGQETVADGSDECGDRPLDLEAVHEPRREPEQERVDDEGKQTECEPADRRGEQLDDGADGRVDQADHEGGDERGADALDLDGGVEVRDEEEGGGAGGPTEEELHRGRGGDGRSTGARPRGFVLEGVASGVRSLPTLSSLKPDKNGSVARPVRESLFGRSLRTLSVLEGAGLSRTAPPNTCYNASPTARSES